MKDPGFKLFVSAVILAIIFGIVLSARDAISAREKELRFCTRWLQLATQAESLKVYKLRPTCLSIKED